MSKTYIHFTEAKLRIIEAVAEGLSDQQIASKLGISTGTVNNELTVVYSKLRSYIGDKNPRIMLLRYYLLHIKTESSSIKR